MADSTQVAHDGRALPWSVLTVDERETIRDINNLLRAIQEENGEQNPTRWGPEYNRYPWAMIDKYRTSRVIMINGGRGAGKTSLLLTLMYGWLWPKGSEADVGGIITHDDAFCGMDKVIKPLTPLDFDPLPPDLSLYSWIIQAFKPLVDKVAGQSHDQKSLDYEKSTRGRYRELQNAALIGWTAGMMKQNLGDFLTAQSEQQCDWQRLQNMWQQFLDDLISRLEGLDGNIFPKGALIALPIDDLDLQASRIRELLLALRVLRHERVVYVLTGHEDNMLVSLRADFYQSYIHQGNRVTEGLGDAMMEQVEKLAIALQMKVIPDSHLFDLKGLKLFREDAMAWGPAEGLKLGEILNSLWSELELSAFVKEHRGLFKRDHAIPFRVLQTFFDRWGTHPSESHDDSRHDGIAKFLEIILDDPDGESVTVNTSESLRTIEISSSRSSFAPVPIDSNSTKASPNAEIHWMTDIDFAIIQMPENDKGTKKAVANPAGAFTFAIELAAVKPDVIKIVNGPEPTERTLGFVWTQTRESTGQASTIFPWPMISLPNRPSEWKRKVDHWKDILGEYSGGADKPRVEDLFKAWCKFLSEESLNLKKSTREHITVLANLDHDVGKDALRILTAPFSGLPESITGEIKSVCEMLEESQEEVDQEAKDRSYTWKSAFVIPVDPYVLASNLLELQDDGLN